MQTVTRHRKQEIPASSELHPLYATIPFPNIHGPRDERNTGEKPLNIRSHTAITTSVLLSAALMCASSRAHASAPEPAEAAPVVVPASGQVGGDQAETSTPTVRIRISIRLGNNDEGIKKVVLARLTEVAQANGLDVAERAPRLLNVVVERLGEDAADYTVRIAYHGPGRPLERLPALECQACDGPSLLKHIGTISGPILEQLRASTRPPPKRVQPKPITPPPPPAPTGPPDGIGLWGAGILLTTLGAALGLGGATGHIILAADKEFDGNPTLGWAFLGAGSAMLGAGIPMIIFGDKRMRRDRRTRANASYNGQTATLGFSGTF